jgi:fumarylacetoacetate (FAA) hydrolase
MKLATYQDGSRDGQLVVVSADLTQAHHASGIATRMQQVLDDWNFLAPQLQDLARTLSQGKARHAFPFEPRMCMAPLPRACRLVDGQPSTGAERIGAGVAGDALAGGRSALSAARSDLDTDFSARLVVALGDVPRGAARDQARDGVRLLLLANHWQHRQQGELLDSSMAFAPVAVTPDELGRAWHRGRLTLTLSTSIDGRALPPAEASPASVPEAGDLIAQLARHRAITAGTLLALPGPLRTALDGGQQVDIDAMDAMGQSVFGGMSQGQVPEAERALRD